MKATQKLVLINVAVAASFLVGIAGAAADSQCSTATGVMTTCSGSTPYCAYPDTGMWREGTGHCQATQPTYTNRVMAGTPGATTDPLTTITNNANGSVTTCTCGACTTTPGTPTTPPTNTPTATTCTFMGQVIAGGTCGYVKTNPAADACNADIMHDGSHWDGTGAMLGVPGVTPDSQLVPMEPGDHCIHGCPEGQSKMDGVHCMTYQAYCAMPTSNCPSMSPGADLVHPASPTNGLGGNVFQAFWNFLTHRR